MLYRERDVRRKEKVPHYHHHNLRLVLCLFNNSHLNSQALTAGFTKAPIDVVFFGLERAVPLPGVNKVLMLLKKCALCDLERTGWAGWEGTFSLSSAERAAKMRGCMWSSEQKGLS